MRRDRLTKVRLQIRSTANRSTANYSTAKNTTNFLNYVRLQINQKSLPNQLQIITRIGRSFAHSHRSFSARVCISLCECLQSIRTILKVGLQSDVFAVERVCSQTCLQSNDLQSKISSRSRVQWWLFIGSGPIFRFLRNFLNAYVCCNSLSIFQSFDDMLRNIMACDDVIWRVCYIMSNVWYAVI